MKKTFTILLNLFVSLSLFAQQDSIQNAGFEQWGPNPTYDDLTNWTTLNPLAQIFGASLAFKATAAGEFHAGTSAVKLVTTNLLGVGDTPSILTNGVVNTTTQEIEGGAPVSTRPSVFGWWHRYDPMGVDSAVMSITFTRWNTGNGTREIVGSAELTIGSTSEAWVNKELTIDYVSSEIPDTVQILFATGDDVSPQIGSTLFLDDFYYGYPAGIESPETVGLNIYPNPTTDILNITSKQGFRFTSGKVYSFDGKLVKRFSAFGNGSSINVSGIQEGSYILELEDTDGTIVRQVFLKK
ncbi:MAG: T9SS type A sorting domain-containing protein [Flavobacteriales bacterium]|nr:T9SS type A sorting domain-containing protein [Flavobacteriales bacterium]